ncbi:MAG: hypothetical protein AAF514_20625, partial [Verrucomicrobiota bacterium]
RLPVGRGKPGSELQIIDQIGQGRARNGKSGSRIPIRIIDDTGKRRLTLVTRAIERIGAKSVFHQSVHPVFIAILGRRTDSQAVRPSTEPALSGLDGHNHEAGIGLLSIVARICNRYSPGPKR